MAGEIIKSKTLTQAREELRNIYRERSSNFKTLSKADYESLGGDEREDSDNHLNEEKLGKEADVIDLAYYKYLKNRQTAYRIILKHKNGETLEDYFLIIPDLA